MATSFVVSGETGAGASRRARYQPMSAINVTPMVDVMLVLLVIFMVTAPLLTVGVPVDLPQTKAPAITEPKEPLVITIDQQGKLYLQNAELANDDQLAPKLAAITQNNPDATIYVRGDRSVNYGRILEVMGFVSEAGFNKVSLIAELPKNDKTKP
jgi:biopolymer transport protein TolR